jgi:RNA polymerase sigma factor (sigma-70 family)
MTNLEFSQIYAKHYPDVVNYVAWKYDASFAEDIAQEVFIKVHRYFTSNFDETKSNFDTWLRTITNRCIIDFYRTNQFGNNCINVTEFDDEETGQSFQFVDKSAFTDRMINNKELKGNINKAFTKLNGRERIVANLYFKREKDYAEIEQLTGLPMGTIKGMINRIRTKLQTQLVA